jgi:predicted ATP-dependent endonuclease of OLD family
MYISKLTLKKFKCFDDVSINFDPNFNLIIGENNSGKSTIFEAFRLWQIAFVKFLKDRTNNESKSSFYSREYYSLTIDELNFLRIEKFENLFYPHAKKIEISITVSNNGVYADLPIFFTLNSEGQNLRFNLCDLKRHRPKVSDYLLRVLEKTKGSSFKDMLLMTYINPIFHLSTKEPKYLRGYVLDKLHQAKANEVIRNLIVDYAPIDYQTSKNKNPKKKGIELIEIEKTIHEILTNTDYIEGQEPLLNFSSNLKPDEDINISLFVRNSLSNIKVEVSQLGSGTLNILNILAVLGYGDYERFHLTVLLLDEPDSHLHSNHQKKLYEDLIKKSKDDNKQIFVITHNHELIDCSENVLFIDHEKIFHTKQIDLIPKEQYYSVYKKIAIEYHQKMIDIAEKKDIEKKLNEIIKPTLYCEGSTDVSILKIAYSKLYNKEDFFNNKIDILDGNSESGVGQYIKSNLKKEVFIIGLLDNDKAGQGQVKNLIKNIQKPYSIIKIDDNFHFQKFFHDEEFNTHILLLPFPKFRIDEADFFEKNLFIEYMFSNHVLEEKLQVQMFTEKGTTFKKILLGEDGKILGLEKEKVTKNLSNLIDEDFIYFKPLFEKLAQIIGFELPPIRYNE